MTSPVPIYLGLGSNLANPLGDPTEHVRSAIASLKDGPFVDVRPSPLYRSKPFGVTDQPDFINAVVFARTALSPLDLLDFCQALESRAGRVRQRHWGERSLDVDILLYDDLELHSERLSIPHAFLWQRNFVLVPLFFLNPDLVIQGHPLKDSPLAHDMTGLCVESL